MLSLNMTRALEIELEHCRKDRGTPIPEVTTNRLLSADD